MIITRLRKHQKYLLEQSLNKGNRIALWADAGIGKTLVALAYAQATQSKRVLVTCDRQNLERTWPVEVKVHTDFVMGFPEKGSHYITSAGTTISLVSHDWLKYHVGAVNALGPFDLWIGDESADYKNPRTLRMQALRNVLKFIRRRMIMSAFPASERLEDVFGQALVLDDGQALGEYITHFRQRFMRVDPTNLYGWVPRANAVNEIREALRPYVVGLPPDMQPDMPEREYKTIYVDLPADTQVHYNKLNREFRLTLQGNDNSLVLSHASVKFMKLFEMCNGFVYTDPSKHSLFIESPKIWQRFPCAKIPVLKGLVEGYTGKSVVWTRFTAEQDFLVNELDVPCWIYRGGKKGLDPFKQHKGQACLLISCQYAKGLNDLVDCHNVVFYSLPWAYITLAQAAMRTCRLTGEGKTNYYHIVVRDTVDEKVYNLVSTKGEFVLSVDGFRSMVD